MKVSLTILPEKTLRQVNIQPGCTVEDVLRACAFLPDSYIVLHGTTPIPITDVLDADSELVAVRVASGG